MNKKAERMLALLYTNILISGIEKWHPERKETNSYFIKHFEGMGKDCKGLLKHHKRENHYISDYTKENSLYMGKQAAEKVLKKTGTNVKEIDMIIFITDTPEYLAPTNALKLNHELQATNAHYEFDMNCGCGGMIVALDLATNQMRTKKDIKKVLLVGVNTLQNSIKWSDVVSYVTFSDYATAILLEKKEEKEQRGFLDFLQRTDSSYHDRIQNPEIGMAKSLMDKQRPMDKKRLNWIPFKTASFAEIWNDMLQSLLKDNNLKIEDISKFCMSQLSPPDNKTFLSLANIPREKYVFNGDVYGYTGISSPILCLYDTWDEYKQGDYVFLISVSAGVSFMVGLYKF
jgi:3-oxoacyl-[acyl-carrier-protein] synthase-3